MASTFRFSLLASMSNLESDQNRGSSGSIDRGEGGTSEALYELKIEINTNLPQNGKYLQTVNKQFIKLIVVNDINNRIVDFKSVGNGDLYSKKLPLGVYNVALNFTISIPLSKISNNFIYLPFQFSYKISKIFLNENKTFKVYLEYLIINPQIIDSYDFDSNLFIEFENNEYLVVRSDTIQFSRMLEEEYKVGWAILYFDDLAKAYTRAGIFIHSDYALYVFTDYPVRKTVIDLKDVNNTVLTLILYKIIEVK